MIFGSEKHQKGFELRRRPSGTATVNKKYVRTAGALVGSNGSSMRSDSEFSTVLPISDELQDTYVSTEAFRRGMHSNSIRYNIEKIMVALNTEPNCTIEEQYPCK